MISTHLKPASTGVTGRAGMLAALVVSVFLTACSTGDDLLKTIAGTKDEILPGKRETILRSGTPGSTGAVAVDPIVIPAAVVNTSWAQPGGVPSNAMHNLETGSDLKRVFKVSAGEGSDSAGRLTASPIVLGARVYVLDATARVRAFSAQNGALIWKSSLVPEDKDGEGAFGGGLASDGSRIYATTAFGQVVALDAATGAEIWRKGFDLPIRAAPTVAGGLIYFSTVSNEVHALNTFDGSQAWKYQGSGEQASLISSTSPAVADGVMVAPYTTGEIVAFRADNGLFSWTDSLSGSDATSSLGELNDVAGRPVIAGGVVYAIAHSGRMAAFKLATGDELWSTDLSGTETPWIAGDYAFVVVGRDKIAAVARSNGGVRWWASLPGGGIWSGPVVGGGRLISVSSKGTLAVVSPQTGQLMFTRDLGENFYIPPVIANGVVYLLADDGTLFALR